MASSALARWRLRTFGGAVLVLALLALQACGSLPNEFVRPGVSFETSNINYRACEESVRDGTYSPPLTNPTGTLAGAAAAGAAQGVGDVLREYQLTAQCMRDRGYLATNVSSAERQILRGPAGPDRERLIADLYARAPAR